jgi:predicted Rdx family selenoprotein
VANVVREFESDLSSITIRPFDDGRFLVRVDGAVVYDKDRTGRFPDFETDIKPKLGRRQ